MERIQECYPGAHLLLPSTAGEPFTLFVQIKPNPEAEERGKVLADLKRGLAVGIGVGGKLHHSNAECMDGDEQHPVALSNTRLPNRKYLIGLSYPPGIGTSFPIHPRARIIAPHLNQVTADAHPHMHHVADAGDFWACPLAPHTTAWRWETGATLSYLDQVAIWILKTEVWLGTGGGIGRLGVWLGPDATHEATQVLSAIRPQDPCRCGRGDRYAHCHMRRDMQAAIFA